MIDLRSDTVTKPTPEMRRAIAEAEVGDDVFGDDPTVSLLERTVAELLGKEAALFVPSGTMANQLAVRLHTQHGDEVLLDSGSHIYRKEAGAAAALNGVSCQLINASRGIFTADELLADLQPADIHHPNARLVCVENTNNAGGGSVWPVKTLASLAAMAHERGLSVHMDGARLWNAVISSGTSEREYASHCDSVSVCFSKGLGAPVGSALAGSADFINRGRRFRKMLGGGMRQSGLLAAGALYALQHHRARLADDHANAKTLAKHLAEISEIEIDPGSIETNIVRFRVPGRNASEIEATLKAKGVALMATGPDALRAVTHLMITRADVGPAAEQILAVLRSPPLMV